MRELSIPSTFILLWNAKSNKFLLDLFSLCMQYLHDNDALLIFYLDDAKWRKELSSYFFNINFKVGHETWTCVNPLHLVNPRISNKTVRLPIFFHVCFHFQNNFDLLHYIIIGFLFYLTFIAFGNSQIHNTLACSFFFIIVLDRNVCLCLFK